MLMHVTCVLTLASFAAASLVGWDSMFDEVWMLQLKHEANEVAFIANGTTAQEQPAIHLAKKNAAEEEQPAPPLAAKKNAALLHGDFAAKQDAPLPAFLHSATIADEGSCDGRNPKYFWECPTNSHRDRKYSAGKPDLTKGAVQQEVHRLLMRLSNDASVIQVKPIVIAGCLIGFRFGGKPLPWDDDCDIAFLDSDFRKFQEYEDEDYQFRINPYWSDRGKNNELTHDESNRIDARLISKNTGYFLDIVALTTDSIDPSKMFQKGGNNPEFTLDWLLPLQEIVFDGIRGLHSPANVDAVLTAYYGKQVLEPRYGKWSFNNETNTWEMSAS